MVASTAITPAASGQGSDRELVERVAKGETVYMVVGVPTPHRYENFVVVADADAKRSAVPNGLWKCWKEASGRHVMVDVSADSFVAYTARWTHPADLRAHLMGEMHGFSAETLKHMTTSDMERLHDEDHDRKAAASPAPPRQPVFQYQMVPNIQSLFRPGAAYCPPGQT